MTIFDFIKYSGTNLNCNDSLLELPYVLLEKYWLEANRLYSPNYKISDSGFYSQIHDENQQHRADVLSRWSGTIYVKQGIFNKVLKEYLDDNI